MKKVKIVYIATGLLELEVEDNVSEEEIVSRFNDKVGFSEDDLYSNLGEINIFEIYED